MRMVWLLLALLMFPAWADPAQDAFATQMMAAIRKAGERRPIRYDAKAFTLVVGKGKDHVQFALHNAYADYQKAPSSIQPQVVERYSHLLGQTDIPGTLSLALPHLIPVVRSRSYLIFNGHWDCVSNDWKPLAGYLEIGLAYDRPDTVMFLPAKRLQEWHLSLDSALQQTLPHLRAISRDAFHQVQPGLFSSTVGDAYDCSRLLLIDDIEKLPLKGAPIALVPERDCLLIAGENETAAQQRMLQLAQSSMQDSTRPIDGRPLVLRQHHWQAWRANPSSPLFAQWEAMRLASTALDYKSQDAAFEGLHKKPYETMQRPQLQLTQNGSEVEVERQPFPVLLPVVDNVTFPQPGFLVHPNIRAPWPRIQAVLRPQLVPGLWPERWQLDHYPTEDELKRLSTPGQ